MKLFITILSIFASAALLPLANATGGFGHQSPKPSCYCGSCSSGDECLIIFDFNHSSHADVNSEHIENVTDWDNGFVLFGSQKVFGLYEAETSFSFEVAEGYKLDIEEISFTTQSTKFFSLLKVADFDLSLENGSGEAFSEGEDGSFYKQFHEYAPTDLLGLTGKQTFTFDLVSDGAFKWSLDDFEICGTLSVVPEPSTVAAVALFGFGSVYMSRRRKKQA